MKHRSSFSIALTLGLIGLAFSACTNDLLDSQMQENLTRSEQTVASGKMQRMVFHSRPQLNQTLQKVKNQSGAITRSALLTQEYSDGATSFISYFAKKKTEFVASQPAEKRAAAENCAPGAIMFADPIMRNAEFAMMLNADAEIQMGDTVYRYCPKGVAYAMIEHEEALTKLDSLLAENPTAAMASNPTALSDEVTFIPIANFLSDDSDPNDEYKKQELGRWDEYAYYVGPDGHLYFGRPSQWEPNPGIDQPDPDPTNPTYTANGIEVYVTPYIIVAPKSKYHLGVSSSNSQGIQVNPQVFIDDSMLAKGSVSWTYNDWNLLTGSSTIGYNYRIINSKPITSNLFIQLVLAIDISDFVLCKSCDISALIMKTVPVDNDVAQSIPSGYEPEDMDIYLGWEALGYRTTCSSNLSFTNPFTNQSDTPDLATYLFTVDAPTYPIPVTFTAAHTGINQIPWSAGINFGESTASLINSVGQSLSTTLRETYYCSDYRSLFAVSGKNATAVLGPISLQITHNFSAIFKLHTDQNSLLADFKYGFFNTSGNLEFKNINFPSVDKNWFDAGVVYAAARIGGTNEYLGAKIIINPAN